LFLHARLGLVSASFVSSLGSIFITGLSRLLVCLVFLIKRALFFISGSSFAQARKSLSKSLFFIRCFQFLLCGAYRFIDFDFSIDCGLLQGKAGITLELPDQKARDFLV
jgi:hypothetical protein